MELFVSRVSNRKAFRASNIQETLYKQLREPSYRMGNYSALCAQAI
jgi:hypothetical protein